MCIAKQEPKGHISLSRVQWTLLLKVRFLRKSEGMTAIFVRSVRTANNPDISIQDTRMHSVCCCCIPIWRRSLLAKGSFIDLLQTRNYHPELFYSQKWESQIHISGFRSRRTLFCQGTLRFEKQVHWRWYREHARVSSRQHFRGLRGKGFPTDSRHSDGHKLCPSPSRHISVLIRSGIHTVFAFNWKEKNLHLSSTSHTDTSMTYCQSITQILRIIWVRCIPLSLRSKTQRRATPLLPTCRTRVTVSCELPFTTNVTISTSIYHKLSVPE